MSVADRVQAMLGRLESMDKQALLTLRENSLRLGEEAAPLVAAIDARLEGFDATGGMARHRLDFARGMLRIAERRPPGQWIASRELFQRAKVEFADNPYAVWIKGNSAREIPLTKALEDVKSEFPYLEIRKEGPERGARVWWRVKPGGQLPPK